MSDGNCLEVSRITCRYMGKFTDYTLPLKTLKPGKTEFHYKLDKQFFVNMESADIRDADVDVTLTVDYNHDVYTLDFAVQGEVTVLCDRCLDEMPWPVEGSYHVVVKYGDEYRDDNDEMLEIPQSAQTLNVAYMIYDTVALAIPMKHVHAPGKCNRQMTAVLKKHRARTTDGDTELEDTLIDEMDSMDADAPTDPRWDALRGLGSNDSDN